MDDPRHKKNEEDEWEKTNKYTEKFNNHENKNTRAVEQRYLERETSSVITYLHQFSLI